MASLVLVVFLVLVPVFVLVLCQKYPAVNKVGAVIICYVLGILLGNIGILPPGSRETLDWVTMVVVPLALPLLLFSLDVKKWTRLARPTLICLGLMVVSVTLVCTGGFFLFQTRLDEAWKVSGMLVGVYTGGTPNLAAIKTALSVRSETYLMVHTADVMISAVFLLFAITAARKVFGRILPPFTPARADKKRGWKKKAVQGADDMSSYAGMFTWPVLNGLLATFGLSVIILAAGEGISLLVPPEFGVAAAILTITTGGILGSLSKKVRNTKKTFQLGQYFILIFCVAVGAMANLGKLANAAPAIMGFVLLAVFGSMILHLILSAFFKVDADTVIITAVAAICSPPFVPLVASALKNKEIVVSGLTVGIIGYALGNYLGVAVAYGLRALFGAG